MVMNAVVGRVAHREVLIALFKKTLKVEKIITSGEYILAKRLRAEERFLSHALRHAAGGHERYEKVGKKK